MGIREHFNFVKDVIAFIQAEKLVIYGQRIAVIRDPEEEVTRGGLIIPDEGKRKEPKGTVVAVGIGVDVQGDDLMYGCNIGDRVMFTKYNPIAFGFELPDGRKVALEIMHVSDLYIGWRAGS